MYAVDNGSSMQQEQNIQLDSQTPTISVTNQDDHISVTMHPKLDQHIPLQSQLPMQANSPAPTAPLPCWPVAPTSGVSSPAAVN